MNWKIPLSTNTAISLAPGENLYVGKNVDVFVEDASAIQATGLNDIIVEGSVISDSYSAIYGSSTVDPSYAIDVTVTRTGYVRGLDAHALTFGDGDCTLNNAGTVIGDSWAIGLSGDDGRTTVINNSGTIWSIDSDGIYSSASNTVVIHNSGTISGKQYAYSTGDGGANTNLITNSGRMHGTISFFLGDDLYDGRKGHIDGTVSGWGGNDRLYGGTEANTLNGGAGDDKIWGGRGADTLFGGTESDRFIFKALSDSTVAVRGRDTIADFEHGIDRIALSDLDANSKAKGDQAFQFIGSQDFHHKAGELHVDRTADMTIVSGDVDGDGKADFAIALSGAVKLSAGDFLL